MLKFFFILLVLVGSAHAETAVFNAQELKSLFSSPSFHDGPNCYNTSLMALGYVSERMYSSGKELDFYLKNFCQEISTTPEEAPNGIVMTYRDNSERLAHAALLMGNGWVFEKNSYRGTNYGSSSSYTSPGYYLFQRYNKSIYASEVKIYNVNYYQCVSSSEVQEALQVIRGRSWALRLEDMRVSLSATIVDISFEKLSNFLTETGFLYLVELQELLRTRTKNALEKEYLYSMAQSVYGQILYAHESAQRSCIQCQSHDVGPLNNELVKTAEILNKYRPRKPKVETAQ
ncbi:hypothetical protein [Bdellovibrio sp. HCB2-146]|uniref:hypothetical protein n=1 Tax=Bdellovibrio sp. HCB2-146 TaxID=3394362 RepID=UPI0039BD5AFF